jgi:hypothetical protein
MRLWRTNENTSPARHGKGGASDPADLQIVTIGASAGLTRTSIHRLQ